MSMLPGTRSALIVVDVQVGVVADAWQRDAVVANIAQAVASARDAGLAVVWVQHESDQLVRDSAPWQWAPELQPQPGEARIHKRFSSSFEDTNLGVLLRDRQVSHLLLAGAQSNWCIRATAYGALERGFDVTLLSDAHTTDAMELAPGRVVEAASVIDDLNAALRWLRYPSRTNAAKAVAEVDFRALAAA